MDRTFVEICDGALGPVISPTIPGAGSVITFEGIIRPTEAEKAIMGLTYEIYSPMAEQELLRLAESVRIDYQLLSIEVRHSRGFVPNFQCSFWLRIAAEHRGEALQAMEFFIDQMKQIVPIWKSSVFADQPIVCGENK